MENEHNYESGIGMSGASTVETPVSPSRQVGAQAQRVVLAGIGAVAEACDTAEQTFDRLVDRGQAVQQEWQGRANDVLQQKMGARGRVREYFRGAMDAFLDGLSVPNKADVDTINVKLNILTRKIDDIQMHQVRETTVAAKSAESKPPPTTGNLAT